MADASVVASLLVLQPVLAEDEVMQYINALCVPEDVSDPSNFGI